MAYDTGILSRYLQGSDSEAINKPNAFGSYLDQFNVDPNWGQYMNGLLNQQQGGQPQGLLGQAQTGGADNPFNRTPAVDPNAVAQEPSGPTGPITLSAALGASDDAMRGGSPLTGVHNQRGRANAVVLSNGQTLGINDFLEKVYGAGIIERGQNLENTLMNPGMDFSALFNGG